jgi:DNA replication licensing factor MCM3
VDNPAHTANAQIQETSPFQKYDQLLHAGLADTSGTRTRPGKKKNVEVLTLAFVKKYIQYAKARPAPSLTKGAADWIVNVYASLRNDNLEDNKRRVSRIILCTNVVLTPF